MSGFERSGFFRSEVITLKVMVIPLLRWDRFTTDKSASSSSIF
jgi:hypothetical protein